MRSRGRPRTAPAAPPMSAPLLPFNVAAGDSGAADAWGLTALEAKAQDLLLGEGGPLEVSENPEVDLRRKLGGTPGCAMQGPLDS